MRILVIKNAEWNDVTFANNLLTNWFEGTKADFANIYCGPGLPLNNICSRYFRITDGQLLKSLFFIGRAGDNITCSKQESFIKKAKENASNRGIYGLFKKWAMIMRTPIMLLRDFLWLYGRYNKEGIQAFIENFKPDIILTYRVFNPQMYKLERLVYKYANVPMVAYTGDDEITNNYFPRFCLSQLRRKYTRHLFRKQSPFYSYYLTHSTDLCNFYSKNFNIPSKVIYKGANFHKNFIEKSIHNPIKLIYAGRLCYGRWKTIVEMGKNIEKLNQGGARMLIYIYSQDILSKQIEKSFKRCSALKFCGSIDGSRLPEIYHEGDIALHIESFETKNATATRYSFSTKIVDLMNSTCAIMAVCEEHQTAFRYLKDNNAAITISSYESIYPTLLDIVQNPHKITFYAKNAWELGKKNHDKEHNRIVIMDLLKRIARK